MQLSEMQTWTSFIFGSLCSAVGILVIIGAVYLFFRDPRASAKSSFAFAMVGVAALFFGNLDRIKSIAVSWTGIVAETREVINEAKDIIAMLRKTAVAMGSLEVQMLAAEGGLQGPNRLLGKDERKEELLNELKGIGLTDAELKKVSVADSRWVKWDYMIYILQPLNVSDLETEDNRRKAYAYCKIYERYDNPLSPDEIKELLDMFHAGDEKTEALLEDYRYYLKNGEQRRPDVWRQRPSGLRVAPDARIRCQ